MTTEKPNYEMIAECLRDYANLIDDGGIDGAGRYLAENIHGQADLIAALSPAPVSEPEPVAWRFKFSDEDTSWGYSMAPRSEARILEPLYTAPPSTERMREALARLADACESMADAANMGMCDEAIENAREVLKIGGAA